MQTDHLTADFPGLESDGRLSRQVRVLPEQRSHYIPLGDPARETYRLSTFKLIPREVQDQVLQNGKSKMTRSYSDGIDPIVTLLTERIQDTNQSNELRG
ncbi:unnamed protein product [Clavelina lepadiformis]|uniref:Uncharacterized protein n=1 Tax=Clavelina lepadiformis TaxID=159417 RepID=A0ABP0FSR3_CLALP